MNRPNSLHVIPLQTALDLTTRPGQLTFTMSPGQWDALLAAAYDIGATLIEFVNDRPARAFKNPSPTNKN